MDISLINQELEAIDNKLTEYKIVITDLKEMIDNRSIFNDRLSQFDQKNITRLLNSVNNDFFIRSIELTPYSLNNPYKNIDNSLTFLKQSQKFIEELKSNIVPLFTNEPEIYSLKDYLQNNKLIIQPIVIAMYNNNIEYELFNIIIIDYNIVHPFFKLLRDIDSEINKKYFPIKKEFYNGSFYIKKNDLINQENFDQLIHLLFY